MRQTIGVVRDVGKSLTNEEILDNMNSGNIKIDKVERFMKKVSENKLEPTFSIKIYAKGQILPKSVEIYGISAHCEAYVFPLRICYKCWRYGHREKFCKASSVKCCKCGLEHPEKECKTTTVKCINCDGAHRASDKGCPERDRQDKIRVDMATNKTSFFEAQQKFPKHPISVQPRLNSNREFPNLPDMDSDNSEAENNIGAGRLPGSRSWSNIIKNGNSSQQRVVKDKMKIRTQPKKFPEPDRYEEEPHVFQPNPFRTSELERLTHQIKRELIEHFNLTGIVEKIQTIQNSILNSTAKSETIEQDLLLINISNQLDSIVNPKVFCETISDSN